MAPVLLLLATHFVLTLNLNQYDLEEYTRYKNVEHTDHDKTIENIKIINRSNSTETRPYEVYKVLNVNLEDQGDRNYLPNLTLTRSTNHFKTTRRKIVTEYFRKNYTIESNKKLAKSLNYFLNFLLLKLSDVVEKDSSVSLKSQSWVHNCSRIDTNETSNKVKDSYGKQNRSIFLELIANGLKLKSDVIKRAHSHTTNQSSDSAKDFFNGTLELFNTAGKYPQEEINSYANQNIYQNTKSVRPIFEAKSTKPQLRIKRNVEVELQESTTKKPQTYISNLNCANCTQQNASRIIYLHETSDNMTLGNTSKSNDRYGLFEQNYTKSNLSDLIFSNGSNVDDTARFDLNVSSNISFHDKRLDKREKFIGEDTLGNFTDKMSDLIIATITSETSVLTAEFSDKVNNRSTVKTKPSFPWPVKKEAIVEGDLVLGGLMMVHEREDTVTCGPVMPQGGIQALEAMLYTLDRLNEHTAVLPNITLGAHILDDCDKDTYGLEMAVDFIKAKHHHIRHHPGQEIHWPVKKEAIVEGNLVLGGLMMVHEREDSVTCGPIMPQGGIQALEAMLYTLDRINEPRWSFLPNITIGAHILDDCDKDTYGLEMAVDFIKGSISNIDGAEYHCNKTSVRKVISGVVGAASSVTSIQVANLLRLFKIPQVSFFSTSPELSNKQRFEYFTRTIPSDHYQVKAMVDIIRRIGWSYISIIYEESNYGIKAFEELEDLLADYNICIAVKEKLVKDSGVADESAYDNIVQKLLTKPRARGTIIFGSDQEVAGVMRAVKRNNATGSFSWIGSDGWSARSLVSDGNEAEVEGTLSVQPQANPVKGFEEYFLSLNVENNRRNPWFVEFWEDHFQCRYPNSSSTPYNQKYTHTCTGKEKLTRQNTVFENQLQFVSDAVMAFAYAIKNMHQKMCPNEQGLCDAMKPTKGTELLKSLRTVDFVGLSGDRFHFDANGDGPARYNIIHFKQVSIGKYRWVRVGEYVEGDLKLNMNDIQFKLKNPKPPISVCSTECDLGQAKKYVEGESCCWHCFNCTQYQIRHPTDPTQCIGCPMGTVPDLLHIRCIDIPEEYLRPESGWAIGAMSLSSVGILITTFVVCVFMRYNDTPVVRASGRELSYVLLAGILMCYCVTFALVFRPTDLVCGIQRFCAGFCFTVVYAALLTKTNRISRIFNAGKNSAKRPNFISPRSQLIICSGFIGVQVLINALWMIVSPARVMHYYPTREDNLLVCSTDIDASYMIAFTYPILLIIVCTVYAVLTRKIPEAFNESKHIGFTMYTTCIIWLAFVPLYFGTASHVALRITSMSVTISLSASVTVVCLFSPKLYIILIRPERNVRQSMMPMRYSAINKGSGTAGSGSMMAPIMLTAATFDQKQQISKHLPSLDPLMNEDSENGKPKMIDSSTLTDPDHGDTDLNNSDMIPKINNNHNPVAMLPLASIQIKEITL